MRKVFGKAEVIERINSKINKSVPYRLLNDVVDIICDFIFDEIAANKTFSVNKLGTFYQAGRKPHLVWSHMKQEKVLSNPKVTVKFTPHVIFSKLLKQKRKSIISNLEKEKGKVR